MKINAHRVKFDTKYYNFSALDASSQWLLTLIRQVYGEASFKNLSLSLKLTPNADFYFRLTFEGFIDLQVPCDRCAQLSDLRIVLDDYKDLAPVNSTLPGGEALSLLDAHDENFSFYDGNEIDLGEIFRDELNFIKTRDYLCREDCLGLCSRCGLDQNIQTCQCFTELPYVKSYRPFKNLSL